MGKQSVLFLCIHNSARSQMAEALTNCLFGQRFAAESAGLQPGKLNPIVVAALEEIGIDIAGKGTRGVAELIQAGRPFDYVITVCSDADAAGCPVFPGQTQRLHWPFPDPSALTGTLEQRFENTRLIRDAIKERIEQWCASLPVVDAAA